MSSIATALEGAAIGIAITRSFAGFVPGALAGAAAGQLYGTIIALNGVINNHCGYSGNESVKCFE